MYSDRVACCPLVSHGEYADGTDGQTDERQTVTLSFPLHAGSLTTIRYTNRSVTVVRYAYVLSEELDECRERERLTRQRRCRKEGSNDVAYNVGFNERTTQLARLLHHIAPFHEKQTHRTHY